MNHYVTIATELVIGMFFLFIITKSLGKTQFSQITPFDFISALILGELVGNAIYDHEVSIIEILFTTFIWGVLMYVLEQITQKFNGSRKYLEGEPNIVVHNGTIKFDALKKSKLDINQLKSLIRQQGYFSIQEIEFAILETNGVVSVLPKSPYDTPKMSDLQLPNKSVSLPVTLILDGKVVHDNLKEIGLNEQWLKEQLSTKGITDYKEVLYAEWMENQPLFTMEYENQSG
jgi:uncharacterized membrane protein YcaP (DUF421 family)